MAPCWTLGAQSLQAGSMRMLRSYARLHCTCKGVGSHSKHAGISIEKLKGQARRCWTIKLASTCCKVSQVHAKTTTQADSSAVLCPPAERHSTCKGSRPLQRRHGAQVPLASDAAACSGLPKAQHLKISNLPGRKPSRLRLAAAVSAGLAHSCARQ